MSKHKHYDMIVAKAANTKLVVFFKADNGWYFDDTSESFKFHSYDDYFLCLPQHKEACLHWLNGGDVQYSSEHSGGFVNWTPTATTETWGGGIVFMSEAYETRIKPKKVKRWIGVYHTNQFQPTRTFKYKNDLDTFIDESGIGYQSIEIEIEVEE